MYIGALKNKKANTNISYTYKKRGLEIPYCPDFISDSAIFSVTGVRTFINDKEAGKTKNQVIIPKQE